MAPYFSVVIPTHNRIATLTRVLGALGAQKEAPDFEVVLIDDGSTDDTAAVINESVASKRFAFPLRFETQPNSGPGRARNRGTALARGTFVVFIGDDTVPEPGFLAQHAKTHRESGDDPLLACLGYTGWPPAETATPFMDHINDYGLQFGYRLIEDGAVVPFNFFYTSNISIARATLGEAPFDTTFPAAAWEDIELAYRLDAAGLKIRYNASAVTRHYHRMDRRLVRAKAIHGRPVGRDLLREASRARPLPRRPRGAREGASPRGRDAQAPASREDRRALPPVRARERVRPAHARALPRRNARGIAAGRGAVRMSAS